MPSTHVLLRPSRALLALGLALVPTAALAQFPPLTLPPSGDNQKASVSQWIGPVQVTIDYSSPDVHAPNGEARRGKIWGTLVPYGLTNLGFGSSPAAPWRAGANENTVFTVSHDVTVQGQPLSAGRYGLHMIATEGDWTLILSKNSTSWGSFFYDPAEDALRVTVKPHKVEYHEWLTYEFVDRQPDHATVELRWEDLGIPFTVAVPSVDELYVAALERALRDSPGFTWQAWTTAAQFVLGRKIHPDKALAWAQAAVAPGFVGQENFTTLSVLAQAQEANGQADAAKATMAKAIAHPTASPFDIHAFGRQLIAGGRAQEALTVFEANARRNPDSWVIDVGMARGLSAVGRYPEALAHAKKALANAPDAPNKAILEAAIAKLAKGQDMKR